MNIKKWVLIITFIAATASAAYGQWIYVGTTADRTLMIERYWEYTVYRDGDVEVWLRASSPYYGRWQTDGKWLVRFNCYTYGAYIDKMMLPDGTVLKGSGFERTLKRSLLRRAAVDACDANDTYRWVR